jgi:transcription elongation factor SPT5
MSSVMARDSIRGYIYVEAMDLASVAKALVSIPGIRYSRRGMLIADLVSTEDRVQLLRMESLGVKKRTWVRITKKGTYFNDLAFVYDLDITEMKACVLVVPRIQISRKRSYKGRHPQSLFDKSAVENVYGADSIRVLNNNFFFKSRCYNYGLLDVDYRFSELSVQPVDPTIYDLTCFRQSQHPAIIKALKSIDVKLYLGDRIQISSGTYQSIRGRLVAIGNQNTVTVQADDSDFGEFEVGVWEVSRYFCLGDGVVIHGGDNSSEEGYVVEIGNDVVVVFVWNDPTRRSVEPGREVSLTY